MQLYKALNPSLHDGKHGCLEWVASTGAAIDVVATMVSRVQRTCSFYAQPKSPPQQTCQSTALRGVVHGLALSVETGSLHFRLSAPPLSKFYLSRLSGRITSGGHSGYKVRVTAHCRNLESFLHEALDFVWAPGMIRVGSAPWLRGRPLACIVYKLVYA